MGIIYLNFFWILVKSFLNLIFFEVGWGEGDGYSQYSKYFCKEKYLYVYKRLE